MTPTVRVVIVSYQTREDLRRCLQVLEPGHRPGLEVVVVDNASTDGSAEMVRSDFPDVRLEALSQNTGFAGGINRGLAASTAEYALVLNPDVELPPNALDALLAFMEANPEAAAASPLLVGPDGVAQEHMYRRFPSVLQVVLFWTLLSVVARRIAPLRQRIMEYRLESVQQPTAVDQLPGAAVLMRGADLERVGPWDAGYFVWWEDVDWCYRARQLGRQLYVLPNVRTSHAGAASFQSWSVQTRVFQFYRAFFRFLCKHELDRLRRWATPVILTDLRLKSALLRLRRRLGLPHPDDVGSLRPTRRAIGEVIARCRQGHLPSFHSAYPEALQQPPHEGRPADSNGPPAVDVVVVNWNGRHFLPECLRALRASSLRPRIVVVDNASTDGSVDWLAQHHPDVSVLPLPRNEGYAGGANAGIAAGEAPFVMVMNPDVRLGIEHLERLVACLVEEPAIGIAQGRLWGIGEVEFLAGAAPSEPRLDSAGHVVHRTRMAYDRGQGSDGGAPWNAEASVFSASGAAVLLRRRMIRDISPTGEPFDPAFFAYKEDVDLGWRARLFGWDVRYLPTAEGYHVRAVPAPGRRGRGASAAVRRHSWVNHWLMILKNDRPLDLLRDLPWVLGWELGRLGHALLRDRALLPAYLQVWRHVPAALRQRTFIQAARRTTPRSIRSWFGRPFLAPAPSRSPAGEPVHLSEPMS